MHDDLPGDGPKNIWLNQPMEVPAMTLKLIRQRSRELHRKTRRRLVGTFAGPFVVGFFYVFSMKVFPASARIFHPLFAFALAWSFAGLYRLQRGMWSAAMPNEAGLSTGLEFCRREIERQLGLERRLLIWSFAPIVLAITTLVLALATLGIRDRGIFPNGLPLLLCGVLWIAAYLVVWFRERRTLRREIHDMADLD